MTMREVSWHVAGLVLQQLDSVSCPVHCPHVPLAGLDWMEYYGQTGLAFPPILFPLRVVTRLVVTGRG